MSPGTKYIVGLLSGALLLVSNGASAQSSQNSRSAQADLLVHQAQALLDGGQVEAACAKFEASQTLENDVRTLLRLADCYEHADRSASAYHAFLEAEALARVQKDREHAQVAAQRVAALEPQLTRLVFVVPMTSRVPGLTVRLGTNTVPPTSWGALIPVDAGIQRVSAAAKGYHLWSVDIDTSRGQGRQFRVEVPTLTPAQGTPTAAARGTAYRTAGVVTGSFGLAGIGAGALFSAMSRNASDATGCAKGVVQCTATPSNKSAFTDAAAVSFALGGALLATGVTLIVLSPSADNQERNSLRVAARYASSGGRLQLEGAW